MRITKHASTRMRERGITEQAVRTAIIYGNHLPNRNDPTKTTVVDNKNKIYVVLASDKKTVITVFTKER